MYRENRLKRRFAEGKKALGCWLQMCSPLAAEIVGQAGFDCVIIDIEHAPGDLLTAISQLQALSASPSTALMRVQWNDPVYIKRALDTGVEGLMIPYVNTAEEARAAVAACLYPPAGIRGAALGATRGPDYGKARAEYVRTVNDNLFIILQIETLRAVDNIPGIAAVDGVDMLFIGPTDLSAAMGRLGRADDPELAAVIARAARAVKDSGKLLGTIGYAGENLEEMFAHGYDLVVDASDVVLLREGAAAKVSAAAAVTGQG